PAKAVVPSASVEASQRLGDLKDVAIEAASLEAETEIKTERINLEKAAVNVATVAKSRHRLAVATRLTKALVSVDALHRKTRMQRPEELRSAAT
ncbi:hypothetical protein IWW45_009423, partial [Coemansia sp. RSA 485]